ncbi:MAG: hypothetical protein NVS3B5_20470 [Sphingomicrobium sp.]
MWLIVQQFMPPTLDQMKLFVIGSDSFRKYAAALRIGMTVIGAMKENHRHPPFCEATLSIFRYVERGYGE